MTIASIVAGVGQLAAVEPYTVDDRNNVISENFNSMAETLVLPAHWAVTTVTSTDARQTSLWTDGVGEVERVGGVSLASNAKCTSYNFGNTDGTDRCVGGITTGGKSAEAIKSINVMTAITNGSDKDIESFTLSYSVKQFRIGTRDFRVALYTTKNIESTGNIMNETTRVAVAAGEAVAGAETVPINTFKVEGQTIGNKTEAVSLKAGSTLYLQWNISVSSGAAAGSAPALGIDDVVITANYGQDAAVNDILVDAQDGKATYYDLTGKQVRNEHLTPGLYIKRQGAKTGKVFVK